MNSRSTDGVLVIGTMMMMAATMGELPKGPTRIVTSYPHQQKTPIAPVKAERSEDQSAARIAAAEAKRNRRAAKRMAEREGRGEAQS